MRVCDPFADIQRFCERRRMKHRIAIGIALACAAFNGLVDTAAAEKPGDGSSLLAPSSEEIQSLYRSFLEKRSCRPSVSCTEPLRNQVSAVDCTPARHGKARCSFLFLTEDYMRGKGITSIATEARIEHCAAMFRWNGKQWRMTAALDDCPSRLNAFKKR